MRSLKPSVAALLILVLLAGACGGSEDDPAVDEAPDGVGVEVPDRAPDLTGTITQVTPPGAGSDVLGTILVEGDLAPGQGRKISYTVTADTKITGTSDGVGVGTFADLATGQTADTWTTGPCAESYPEQCGLEAIRVTG